MDEKELKAALNELKADLYKLPLVHALASGDNLTDALRRVGRSKSWYYSMSEREQNRLIEIATALKTFPIIQAKLIIDSAVVDAAKVKVGGLKNKNPKIQQAASTEILNRSIGEEPKSNDVNIKVTITGLEDA